MPNWPLSIFLAVDAAFFILGIASLIVAVLFEKSDADGSPGAVAAKVLLPFNPVTAGAANAIPVILTFLLSIPGVILFHRTIFLRVTSYLVIVCGFISTIIGLAIWLQTLQTRSNLNVAWGQLSSDKQSQMQQLFQCCGYLNPANPPFITDATCTDATTAQKLGGCVTPFSNFSNSFLDVLFTGIFGIVALDAIVFLAAAVLAKDRAQQMRWRLIDRKYGYAAL